MKFVSRLLVKNDENWPAAREIDRAQHFLFFEYKDEITTIIGEKIVFERKFNAT